MGVFDFLPDDPNQNGTRVITFKGTSTKDDMFLDLSLYTTVKMLDLGGYAFPILKWLPFVQSQWLILFAYRLASFGFRKPGFLTRIHEVTSHWVNESYDVVLTG